MRNHRFTLEPYNGMKTRHKCPNCNNTKAFTRYIDLETQEYLNESVGKCSRLIKCGYHFAPKDYFRNNNISFKVQDNQKDSWKPQPKPNPKTSFISHDIMRKSKATKSSNYFLDFLSNHWNKEVAFELVEKYNIGTSMYWPGATVFWQVDNNSNIRSGKIMLYNASNGKRVKEPYNHINWVHSVLKLDDFNLEQCYFGEHLLNDNLSKPVAIVESEKTAIICSVYLPEFIWLACGSVNNLNEAKTRSLKGRNVVLFPDLNCYDLWNDKIPELTKLATFRVSRLLENKATPEERELGLDIADYLIKIK